MRNLAKLAIGALLLVGSATAFASPASARVSVGFGFGVEPYGPRYSCDPYGPYYDPYYCGDAYYDYWYDPVFYDGGWYYGPLRYRWYGGHREYWLHNAWHGDQWRGGDRPFRGGGWGGGGHWGGHEGGGHWGGGGHEGGGHWGGGGGHRH